MAPFPIPFPGKETFYETFFSEYNENPWKRTYKKKAGKHSRLLLFRPPSAARILNGFCRPGGLNRPGFLLMLNFSCQPAAEFFFVCI